jgi:hypothetical protein
LFQSKGSIDWKEEGKEEKEEMVKQQKISENICSTH